MGELRSKNGVTIEWPALPRHKTVYAAIAIDKSHFDAISSALSGEPEAGLLAEEVKEADKLFEGASKTITVNAYERSRKARNQVYRVLWLELCSM